MNIIDFYPCEECKNDKVIYTCKQCNKCGRFKEEE